MKVSQAFCMWDFFLGTIIGGIFAWVTRQYFAASLEQFRELRSHVSEALLFTANISRRDIDPDRYDEAVDELRRLAAQLKGLHDSSTKPVRWYFARKGYELPEAIAALIGYSNSLSDKTGQKGMHKYDVQMALKLPLSYPERPVPRD
jgi:hypothetical protein